MSPRLVRPVIRAETIVPRTPPMIAGVKCSVRPTEHIRLATAILPDRYDVVAEAVALAAGAVGDRAGIGRHR